MRCRMKNKVIAAPWLVSSPASAAAALLLTAPATSDLGAKSQVWLLHPLKQAGNFGQDALCDAAFAPRVQDVCVLPSAHQQGPSYRRRVVSEGFLLTRSNAPSPRAAAEQRATPAERGQEQCRQFTILLQGCYNKAHKWPHKGNLGGSWEYTDKHNSPLI